MLQIGRCDAFSDLPRNIANAVGVITDIDCPTIASRPGVLRIEIEFPNAVFAGTHFSGLSVIAEFVLTITSH